MNDFDDRVRTGSPLIIAFYLPQFHPTKDNDEWWGEGFTEWTNVVKAKKLYPGHYQPKVPTCLGFYDLRIPEVREKQAMLAKEAGVSAFCYYHYWFEAGHEELERPFNEVVASGKPDFPFCLCWANESWHAKFWKKDGTADKRVLVEQKYLGEKDNVAHFLSLLPAFKDSRYLRIKNRLVFMIYQPFQFVGLHEFMSQWQKMAQENGLEGFYFIGQTTVKSRVKEILDLGFDAVNLVRLYDASANSENFFIKAYEHFVTRILNYPFVHSYSKAMKKFVGIEDLLPQVYPTLIPNWDHTPRSQRGGYVLHNCTPELFCKHADEVLNEIKQKPKEDQVVFLKSWNEWGEGNYMEPDLKWGKSFIFALRKAIDRFEKKQ